MAVELASPILSSPTFMKSTVATLETRTFPERLKRKQERRHGWARSDYRELLVEPFKEILRTEGSVEQVGLTRALHYCRGYIRVYTLEPGGPGGADIQEPIIQAVRGSMRGSRRSGEVKKDYRVDEPRRPHRRPPYPDE